jgi:hypothetical protein
MAQEQFPTLKSNSLHAPHSSDRLHFAGSHLQSAGLVVEQSYSAPMRRRLLHSGLVIALMAAVIAAEMQRLRGSIARLTQALATQETAPPGLQQATAAGTAVRAPKVPYEKRTHAMIGQRFPNDAPRSKAEIEFKAGQVLDQAGIASDWLSVKPVAITRMQNGYRTGISAELVFKAPELLTRARLMIRSLDIQNDAGRVVWLDARRTRSENAPARSVHLMGDVLQDLCEDKGIPVAIGRDIRRRTISNGDEPFVSLVRCAGGMTWIWSAAAKTALSEDPYQGHF